MLAGDAVVMGRAVGAGFFNLRIDAGFCFMIRFPLPAESSLILRAIWLASLEADIHCNELSVLDSLDGFNKKHQSVRRDQCSLINKLARM